jgi:translation initiation factor IF-3
MRRIYRRPQPKEEGKRFRANEQINAREVFLIDDEGQKIGLVSTHEARQMAIERELDLVEVNPHGNPPVAKIMDYGQFKYEQDKLAQKQKSKQKKIEIKGIRLSPRISEHDLMMRQDQAKKFLSKGDKLKVELILKGREKQHTGRAIELMKEFVVGLENDLGNQIVREQDLTKQGGRYNMVLFNRND